VVRVGSHEEFTEYALARAVRLREFAYLLCGDWHQAQDLTQATLAKVFVAWERIHRRDSVDAYARTVMLRELLTERRRRRSGERPMAEVPEPGVDAAAPGADTAALRLTLLDALRRLAPNRRAVIVLRYWDDQSVEAVAEIMRLTPAAVKSLTVRALQDLRTLLGTDLTVVTP
jgi:RNA polymerase sigma-70 factor (sigma-E family)